MTIIIDTRAARLTAAGFILLCMAVATLAGSGLARAGDASLADRVRVLEDEREIHELLVMYGRYLDALDFAGYSRLFAREGTWNGRATNFVTVTGPEEIRTTLEKVFAETPKDPEHPTMVHLMTNMKIAIDGDRAAGYSKYTVFYRDKEDKPYVSIAGHYDDTYIREDGQWKFLSRVARWDMP